MEGLRNGDVLTAITLQSRISSTERAFALWCPGGSRIVTWGDPSYGGDAIDISETFRDVQDVQGSHRAFAILLGDGEVVTRGDRGYGGDSLPVQHLLQNVKRLFSTLRAFSALKTDGSIVTWGPGGWGGDSTKVQLQLGDVQHVYSTDSAFAAHLQNGSVVTWGGSCWGGDSQKVQEELQEVEDVTATCGAFAAKLANGKVVTWGHPDFGADSSAVEEKLRDVKVVKDGVLYIIYFWKKTYFPFRVGCEVGLVGLVTFGCSFSVIVLDMIIHMDSVEWERFFQRRRLTNWVKGRRTPAGRQTLPFVLYTFC